ncbi:MULTISPECIES: type I phosphoribosyltransferase [Streptomyces]|uniref:phosphoribosyltransferase n=1 Tax=Streptomyces TaxID=1883 RepID=UPI00163CC260|nr:MULTISPECIES: phosphoribosyltransferase [Streptomyces]MBC2874265.1 hypothetical protein [Streptomyces sp. TYQ1024]UBI40300.1 phosphoribosyltransferase [Streptomyces mobaraensis]UKW32880.1 phosphoribosyltransferase [Streptomyces sp. TYQ1024]
MEKYEREYGACFSHLLHFDSHTLKSLHAPGELPSSVRVASDEHPAVIDRMAVVTEIANLPERQEADRRNYLRALLDIYDMLPTQVRDAASVPGAVVIAPEREGRILAELLGVLTHHQGWTPQAKRMPTAGGLVVGVDRRLPARCDRLVIVDGVVASGATLMAMMHLATRPGAVVDVFTCHATAEGALALSRYAEQWGVSLTVHVGHVSGILNEKFYSVEPGDQSTLVLGDIGDTISPIASGTKGVGHDER